LHANYFVNVNQARAEDVRGLIDVVRDEVRRRFGVLLEPEVKVISEKGALIRC